MNSAPFFIVGSGRSGTTLVRLILGSHSRLSIPPETWYLNKMTDLLMLDRPLSLDERQRVVRIMTEHYRWPDLGVSAEVFRQKVGSMESPRLRQIVELVYFEYMQREQKRRWGDKTPGYIELVPQLAHLFPGARFIHVIRDGRDVAKSFQARRWSGKWLHLNAQEWLVAMQCGQRWRRSNFATQFLEIRYEDVVRNPERELRRICEFLEEQYEPQMLSWQHRVGALVPTREAHIHEKLVQEPSKDDIERWKREMSAREILIGEAFMGPLLKAHGYELRYAGRAWQPLLWLTRWYCRLVLPVANLSFRAFRFLKGQIFGLPAPPEANAGIES